MLEERIRNYREAAASAKEAGEAAKARRCERGLKVSRALGVRLCDRCRRRVHLWRGGACLWAGVIQASQLSGLVLPLRLWSPSWPL